MTAPIRVAVIGAGVMGANHIRLARQLHNAELTLVVDPDLDRARAAAAASGAVAAPDIDDVAALADLAVLAVPTAHHESIAVALASAGVHLLVEKPLAGTTESARRIVEAADAAGVLLAVGHVERFNAASARTRPVSPTASCSIS